MIYTKLSNYNSTKFPESNAEFYKCIYQIMLIAKYTLRNELKFLLFSLKLSDRNTGLLGVIREVGVGVDQLKLQDCS